MFSWFCAICFARFLVPRRARGLQQVRRRHLQIGPHDPKSCGPENLKRCLHTYLQIP